MAEIGDWFAAARGALAAAAAAAAFAASAAEWRNVSPEDRIGGRAVSVGYLRGKVVLIDRRDYADPANAENVKRLQSVWKAYSTKPFVLVGGHVGGDADAAKSALASLGVTYPVCGGAALVDPDPHGNALVVLDPTGSRILYAGSDDRQAAGVVGSAIIAAKLPKSAKQWKFLLDYEIENLPGRAYLRLRELNADKAALKELAEKYTDDAKRYRAAATKFKADAEVVKLAKLVETAAMLKDRDPSSPKAKRITKADLEKLEAKYAPLKESENPLVAQEAKNSLYDIRCAKATLAK